jgi:hypothetical protein
VQIRHPKNTSTYLIDRTIVYFLQINQKNAYLKGKYGGLFSRKAIGVGVIKKVKKL